MQKKRFAAIILHVMKITIIQGALAFIFTISSFANDIRAQRLLDRTVSMSVENMEIKKVLSEIQQQTGVKFSYSSRSIRADRKISFTATNNKLGHLLDLYFKPLQIEYKIVHRQLLLYASNQNEEVQQQKQVDQQSNVQEIKKRITGIVQNLKGEPLAGVTVQIKGREEYTTTDENGGFSIDVQDDNAVLVLSYTGYLMQEVTVGNESTLQIFLVSTPESLNEVVVVGYGTQKKVNLTGSVATVSGKELLQAPTTNLTNALAGRLPGLIAVNGNGKPGSGSRISVRGASTFGDNSALIIVDGNVRDFEQIDPNEIESISVLKDASATAVYGSRAANGVILVTTKRGRTGKPTFNYNGFAGVQQPTSYPRVMNAAEYAVTKNVALANMGKPAKYTEQELDDIINGKVPETDWYDLTMNDNAFQTQHNISVNGGSEAIKYFLSLGYLDQNGLYDMINYKRYSIRSNVDAQINKNLVLSADFDARVQNNNGSGFSPEGIFDDITSAYPLDMAYNPDGTVFYTHEQHPVEEIKTGYQKIKTNILQATVSFKQEIPFITGLSLAGKASFGKEYVNNKHYQVPVLMNRQNENGETLEIYPFGGWNGKTGLYHGTNEYNTTLYTLNLNYNRTFGDHAVSGLALFEQFDATASDVYAFRTNFPANGLDELFYGGQEQKDAGGGSFNDGRQSFVTRANYTYKDRYLLEASFRFDGSVAFPESKKYGFFPAVSAGWRISEEAFMQNSNALSFIDNLKLRASYGVVGNDRNVYQGRRPTFQYLQVFNPAGTWINGTSVLSSIIPGVLPNPNVTWESAAIANIGVDGSMWNQKFQFEVDVFHKRTSDILLSRIRSIPATLGAQLPAENYATVDNKGLEVSVTHNNNIGALRLFVRANGSFSRSKVITLDEPANIPDYLRQTGRPLGFRLGYKALGFFESDEDVAKYLPQFNGGQKAGDVKYADINGDGKVDANDQTIISMDNNTPKITGGLSFGGSYKRFDLAVLFQGAAKVNIILDGTSRNFFQGGSRNGFANLLDYWTPENKDAAYPRPWEGPHPNNSLTSSLYLRDTRYVRLKSVDIGYTIPENILNKAGIDRLRLYFTGSNLFVWDKLKMFDPEIESANGLYYPQQRTLNVGVNLTF